MANLCLLPIFTSEAQMISVVLFSPLLGIFFSCCCCSYSNQGYSFKYQNLKPGLIFSVVRFLQDIWIQEECGAWELGTAWSADMMDTHRTMQCNVIQEDNKYKRQKLSNHANANAAYPTWLNSVYLHIQTNDIRKGSNARA